MGVGFSFHAHPDKNLFFSSLFTSLIFEGILPKDDNTVQVMTQFFWLSKSIRIEAGKSEKEKNERKKAYILVQLFHFNSNRTILVSFETKVRKLQTSCFDSF